MILENEVMELFSLCMQVTARTSAFVEVTMASHTKGCYIHIRDAGYEPNAKMDARYTIFFNSTLQKCKRTSGKIIKRKWILRVGNSSGSSTTK